MAERQADSSNGSKNDAGMDGDQRRSPVLLRSSENTVQTTTWETYASGAGYLAITAENFPHVQALHDWPYRPYAVTMDQTSGQPVCCWPLKVYRPEQAMSIVAPERCPKKCTVFAGVTSTVVVKSEAWCQMQEISVRPQIGTFEFEPTDEAASKENSKSYKLCSWFRLNGLNRQGPKPDWPLVDYFKENCFVAVEHANSFGLFWPAKIIRRVYDRLLLQPAGKGPESAFWLSCYSCRIRSVSQVVQYRQLYDWSFKNSDAVRLENEAELLEEAVQNSVPSKPFQAHRLLTEHNLKVGSNFEMLHPFERDEFYPATVTEILNDYYFTVRLVRCMTGGPDGGPQTETLKLHRKCTAMVPVNWCLANQVRLAGQERFKWQVILSKGSSRKPRGAFFENGLYGRRWTCGRYVSVAMGDGPTDRFALGLVTKVCGPFIWVHTDYYVPYGHRVYDVRDCCDLYPCGYDNLFKVPLLSFDRYPAPVDQSAQKLTIYININCYVGPFLCKTLLRRSPSYIGPGSAFGVLRELLQYVTKSLRRPAVFLRAMHCSMSRWCKANRRITVKTRYTSKRKLAKLIINRDPRQTTSYLHHMCSLLGACRCLFSVDNEDGSKECPYRCMETAKPRPCCSMCNLEYFGPVEEKKMPIRRKRRSIVSTRGRVSAVKRRALHRSLSDQSTEACSASPAVVVKKVVKAEQQPPAMTRGVGRPKHRNMIAALNSESKPKVDSPYTKSSHLSAYVMSMSGPSRDASSVSSTAMVSNGSAQSHRSVAVKYGPVTETHRMLNLSLPPVESNPLSWNGVMLCSWMARIEGFGRVMVPIILDQRLNGESFMICESDELSKIMPLGEALKAVEISRYLKEIMRKFFCEGISGGNQR